MEFPYLKYSHCSFCGTRFELTKWPRTCLACRNITYRNPVPVVVVMLRVDGGVLGIRRDIAPKRGELALPGGFMDMDETVQEAGARELFEETGIRIPASHLEVFDTDMSSGGAVLLFLATVYSRTSFGLPPFVPNVEVTERVVLSSPIELAFPSHTKMLRKFFEQAKQ